MSRGIAFSIGLVAATACATAPETMQPAATRAQLFEGLGSYDRQFTTSSREAHDYLVQGLTWTQAFNYDEAIRSFRKAAELDPDCAMAWWGIAYASGPSYNHARLTPERQEACWNAIHEALARIDNTNERERDLIEALSERFEDPYPTDDSRLDEAYSDAMGRLWEKYPDDADIGMLYAEALMVRTPWQLYDEDREPAENTELIEKTLERVLELNPNLPGACHLYIHSVELSKTPNRGLAVADRLSKLVPLSGHLLHMPSHIYTRTGDWDRAIEQNALAMEADVRYRGLSPEQHTQYLYMVHNNHIRAYAAMMAGREEEATYASRRMWEDIPAEKLEEVAPLVDAWMCSLYDSLKRFGRWDQLLAEPAPPEYMPITSAMWRAHRAVAYAAKHDFDAAEREFAAYKEIRENIPQERLNPYTTVSAARRRLSVIEHFVPGEIALQKGDYEAAVEHLKEAVKEEDKLGYSGEPPDYLQPIRHTLGAVLIKKGDFAEAEAVFRRDLEEFPENGWSLYGLSRALEAQGKTAEALKVEEEFRIAWKDADAPITTSCMCVPEL